MDESAVAAWLADYVAAWRSNDPETIGRLFAEDALYRYHPWAEPTPSHVRGGEAIVASWLQEPDEPDSWEAEYRPWLVSDDRAVAVGASRYFASDGSVEGEFSNVFLLAFDAEGRCREFSEIYMKRPAR